MSVWRRGIIGKLRHALEAAATVPRAAHALLALWDDYMLVMKTHMMHEDEVVFAAADSWIPHHCVPFEEARTLNLFLEWAHSIRLCILSSLDSTLNKSCMRTSSRLCDDEHCV
jgi:hypothetical protein